MFGPNPDLDAPPEFPYEWLEAQVWPIQDIVLCLGLCAQINTILCAPTLCLGTPLHTVITHTIAQYNVTPRPPVIAIYTTQYWQLQYLVKAKPRYASYPFYVLLLWYISHIIQITPHKLSAEPRNSASA